MQDWAKNIPFVESETKTRFLKHSEIEELIGGDAWKT